MRGLVVAFVCLGILIAVLAGFLLSWNTRERSFVVYVDERNIEIHVRETAATAHVTMQDSEQQSIVHIHQEANTNLLVSLSFECVAYLYIHRTDGTFYAMRIISYDESFTIPPSDQDEQYTFTVRPRFGVEQSRRSTISIRPQFRFLEPDTHDYSLTLQFDSPSCLQLAKFAHMAYSPLSPPYEETQGWELYKVHLDEETDFSAVLYVNHNHTHVVLALRGTAGGLQHSLATRSGSWWCNFMSLGGQRHSHRDSLVDFLAIRDVFSVLRTAHIYIVGHSLGGYLAYAATYELAQLGLASNIRRVVAFSAPIFSASTIDMVSSLSPNIRNRMSHYYVPYDRIAGIIGTERTNYHHDYLSFAVINNILRSLYQIHGADIPQAFTILTSILTQIESLLPFLSLPENIHLVMWHIQSAFTQEAYQLSSNFSELIWHTSVPQTWDNPRPAPPWSINIPFIGTPITYVQELAIDVLFDMLDRVFDAGSHFMMNFYDYLALRTGIIN